MQVWDNTEPHNARSPSKVYTGNNLKVTDNTEKVIL